MTCPQSSPGISKYQELQLKQAAAAMIGAPHGREATTEETRGAIREELQHRPPPVYDGYGFRPASGVSTPLHPAATTSSPIPDVNGLGWPGKSRLYILFNVWLKKTFSAKSTISRLNSTPAERLAREEKLASAVRTILEGIGEDPDRDGLLRTPERYAQALLWMTRGYEERLSGKDLFRSLFLGGGGQCFIFLHCRCHQRRRLR